MVNDLATKEEKSLCLIASDKSITFDEGQIYVSKYLDTLLAKINNFKKDNIYLEIYGFLPSLFSMILLFLNLIEYNQILIFNLLIILFLIQLSIDLFLSLKNYFPIDYFIKLRIPITSSLSLSLLFISKL